MVRRSPLDRASRELALYVAILGNPQFLPEAEGSLRSQGTESIVTACCARGCGIGRKGLGSVTAVSTSVTAVRHPGSDLPPTLSPAGEWHCTPCSAMFGEESEPGAQRRMGGLEEPRGRFHPSIHPSLDVQIDVCGWTRLVDFDGYCSLRLR